MRRAFIAGLKKHHAYLLPGSCSTARTTLHRAAQRHTGPPSPASRGFGLLMLCLWGRALSLGVMEERANLLACPYQQQQGTVLAAFQGGLSCTQALNPDAGTNLISNSITGEEKL